MPSARRMLATAILLVVIAAVAHIGKDRHDRFKRYVLAVSAMKAQRWEDAEARLRESLIVSPQDAYLWHLLAVALERRNSYSIDWARFASARDPWVIDADSLRRLPAAAESCDRSVMLAPMVDAFSVNCAWIAALQGDRERARTHAERAARLNEAGYVNRVTRALLRAQDGEPEAAGSDVARALAIAPGLLDSRFFRDFKANHPVVAGSAVRAATESLRREYGRTRSPIVAARLGRLSLELEPAAASRLLEEAVAQRPALGRAWANLARLSSDPDARYRYVRTGQFFDSTDPIGALELARILDSQGDQASALRYYDRALTASDRSVSPLAGRAVRSFGVPSAVADDLIPRGLLRWLAAEVDGQSVARRVSEIRQRTADPFRTLRIEVLAQ